jgi:hypothetical protein
MFSDYESKITTTSYYNPGLSPSKTMLRINSKGVYLNWFKKGTYLHNLSTIHYDNIEKFYIKINPGIFFIPTITMLVVEAKNNKYGYINFYQHPEKIVIKYLKMHFKSDWNKKYTGKVTGKFDPY